MDRSIWLPWAWGAGAVVCAILLCLVQPWRQQFRTARQICQESARLWAIPALAALAELLWQWHAPGATASSRSHIAGLLTGDSLAKVLTWIVRGEMLAMVLAAAFLANSGGLRQGLWKGIDTVFPAGWRRVLQLTLLASATACLGIPAVRFGAGGETGLIIVRLASSLWTSTAATMLMCWLIVSLESFCRASGRAGKGRRADVTGQYTVRLWLPVLAGAVAFPLMDAADEELRGVLRAYAWPAAAIFAWFPLTALRFIEAGHIHSVLASALRRWVAGLLPFTGWLTIAGVHFFAFHLLSGWLVTQCDDGSWLRAAVAIAFHGIWPVLAVRMLGAWVAIQVDRFPPDTKNARPERHSANT
jgi:hypothetical protein